MSKLLRTFLALALALSTGCGQRGVIPQLGHTQPAAPTTARLAVPVRIAMPPPKLALQGFHIKHVNVADIAYVDIRATHPGGAIDTPAEGNPIALTNNQASATLNLPVGRYQIITAQGLDRRGKPIPGAVIKGITSIWVAGTNVDGTPRLSASAAIVNSATTPAARIVEAIYAIDPTSAGTEITDLGDHAQTLVNLITGVDPASQTQTFQTVPSLINTDWIANQIYATRIMPFKPSSEMIMQAGTVTVHVVDPVTTQPVSGASVVVSDPLSALGTTNSSGDATITGVAPGTWSVMAGGTFIPVQAGQAIVGSGQTMAADPQPTCYTPQQTPTQIVGQSIGPNGGSIYITDVATLQIPANAVPQQTTFRLSTYADTDPTRLFGLRIEPENLPLNLPATLTFHYTDAQLAAWGITNPGATGELLLTQYKSVPGGGLPQQTLIPAVIDTTNKTLTALLNQTGTASVPAGVMTVQGFHTKADDPKDPTGLHIKRSDQLDEANDVTLSFTPVPNLRLNSLVASPPPVYGHDTATFPVELISTDGKPFDYTYSGVSVQGRLLDPTGTETDVLHFSVDTHNSTPLRTLLNATHGNWTKPGPWTLVDIDLVDSASGVVIWHAASQTLGVNPKITSISPTSGTCRPTITLSGETFGIYNSSADFVILTSGNVGIVGLTSDDFVSWTNDQIVLQPHSFSLPPYDYDMTVDISNSLFHVTSNSKPFSANPCITSAGRANINFPGYFILDGYFFTNDHPTVLGWVNGSPATVTVTDPQPSYPFSPQEMTLYISPNPADPGPTGPCNNVQISVDGKMSNVKTVTEGHC